LNTLIGVLFVITAFHSVPDDIFHYAAGCTYRAVSLLTCALMWQLQHRLHDAKTHLSMHAEE
jgi:hypothetical protein